MDPKCVRESVGVCPRSPVRVSAEETRVGMLSSVSVVRECGCVLVV